MDLLYLHTLRFVISTDFEHHLVDFDMVLSHHGNNAGGGSAPKHVQQFMQEGHLRVLVKHACAKGKQNAQGGMGVGYIDLIYSMYDIYIIIIISRY